MELQTKWLWILALIVISLLAVGGGWILTQARTDDAKADRLVLFKSTEATNIKRTNRAEILSQE